MAEREFTLVKRDRVLETSLRPDLVLRASAERDFLRATSLASSSGDIRQTTMSLITVLGFQGATDIDAAPLRATIQDALPRINPLQRSHATSYLARVELGLGNIPAANAALEATSEIDTISHLRLDFARGYAKAGIDPKPMLDKVEETAGRVRIKMNPDVFEIRTGKQIDDVIALAVTHSQLNLNPTPFLTEARALLEDYESSEKDFQVGKLIKAYALCGDFANAVALVDTITTNNPEKTKEKRTEARYVIAQEQLKYGDIAGALHTAVDSEDNTIIGETNAQVAIYKAEKGEDPTEEIDRTLSLIPTIESDLSQGLLYSMLGRAKALTKENPTPMFVMAMEKALSLEISEDPMAELFNRFTEDVDASGFDATPVFDIALYWVLRASKVKLEPGNIVTPDIYQGMATEAIVEQQIKLGYLEMAEQTLPRLESESWVYIPLLANLASAKAKRAAA